MKRFTFSVPQNILFGEGVLKELPGAAGKLGGKHGFIISGPTLNRLGVVLEIFFKFRHFNNRSAFHR